MTTPKPGLTLNSTGEVLACNEVVETVLTRLPPKRRAHVEEIFAPLGQAACEVRENLDGIKDEEELAELIDEIDPAEKVEISPVIGIDFKTAKLLEAMFKKFAEGKGSETLSPGDASLTAREIETVLKISSGAGISFN